MAINGISSSDQNYFSAMLGTNKSTDNNKSSGVDSLLGSGASSGVGLGDYAMIQNGAYKKLLNAYYNKKDTEESAGQKAEKIRLTTASSDASGLGQEVNKLLNIAVNEENRETIKENLKSVIEKYNAVIDSASTVDDTSVLRQALWMTQDTSALAVSLSDIGISVGTNNKLTLDESKFDTARLSSIKTLTEGRGSYFGKLSDRSAMLNGAASKAVSGTTSKSLYRNNGDYEKNSAGNNIDKTE